MTGLEHDGQGAGTGAATGDPGIDSPEELRYLANLAVLITGISGRLVALRPEQLDDEINDSLREIGEFAAVDRSYVFQFSEDGARVTNTHEWCAPGIDPAMDHIQDTPVEMFEWAMSRLMRGEVLYVEQVRDLPADAASVKAELDRQQIQSMINLPLICSGKVLGFVGFDSVRHPLSWTDEHIKLLKAVGEIIAGAIERTRATTALRRQVEMETLVAQISTRFINVPLDRLDAEIGRAIRSIGRFTGVDRSYIFKLDPSGLRMSNSHEWCAPGIEPHIDRLQDLPVDVFGYSMQRMRRGEVFYVADVGELPAEAAAEQAEFEAEGIRTLINVPIMLREKMTGFLGFDAVHLRKVWTDDDIRLLLLVGVVLANALDRSAAEQRLQASVREKEVLLREIHHRVKNNLQIVDSLLYLQVHAGRDRVDPVALDAFTSSRSRIRSMAVIHDRLYRTRDLSGIDFGEYLRVLLPELQEFHDTEGRIAVRIEADTLQLPLDQAIPCGLIVNELVTNSFKHGFPAGRRGTVSVSLHGLPDGGRQLAVIDDGVGSRAGTARDVRLSMGMQLVRDLARQLGGTVEVLDGAGTGIRIVFGEPEA